MQKCPECNSEVENKFSYCPYCGTILIDEEEELEQFGMLGKNDFRDEELLRSNMSQTNLGVLDKVFASLMNNLISTMSQQIQDTTEVKSYPGGIRIKIGSAPVKAKRNPAEQQKISRKALTTEQAKKMSEFPRVKAKTAMRRLGDKIVYELSAPGVSSPNDIFLAKLESGYEIKAIGDSKIYINNLPINLPLRGVKIQPDKVLIEFMTNEEENF